MLVKDHRRRARKAHALAKKGDLKGGPKARAKTRKVLGDANEA